MLIVEIISQKLKCLEISRRSGIRLIYDDHKVENYEKMYVYHFYFYNVRTVKNV